MTEQKKSSLQKKKNALRKTLAKRGVLQKKGHNTYDKYTYFSEAQYKELFTELFSSHGIELSFSEEEYCTFDGKGNMPNGRLVKLRFRLTDIDTGETEETIITGEALDRADKAGYKAYTGALKYFLATTFMVATGDEVEASVSNVKSATIQQPKNREPAKFGTPQHLEIVALVKTGKVNMDTLKDVLKKHTKTKVQDLSPIQAANVLEELKNMIGNTEQGEKEEEK